MPTQDPSPRPSDPAGPRGAPLDESPAMSRVTKRRTIAVNTAIFSLATGASRVVGLGREVLASSLFATSGAISAFTIAFQVPNLLRQLVADQAITSAFVPVFTELLEKNRRAEAFRLASTFFFLIVAGLGSITALFVVLAPVIMPLLTGSAFDGALDDLVSGLSQILFPIVVLLGLNGLCVGILNAYDHFLVPALSPLVWNFVIIAVLLGTRPFFSGDEELYAYAIGVLAGTTVQFLMAFPVLRAYGFRFTLKIDVRDRLIGGVLKLMIPVTISLGLINFNLVINATFGSLVSEQAPRAIDAAFRIYMLPQGMFSVALATVLFPALARLGVRGDTAGLRHATANGVRQISMLLIPSAAFTLVLSEPITRLVYERGEFGPESTELVASALLWFSFSLPLNGVNLLLTRTFFSIKRPWRPTGWAGANVLANVAVSLALYEPFGIPGIVIGTTAGNAVMLAGQWAFLRTELGGLESRRTVVATLQMLAGAALLGGVAYGAWYGLNALLGDSLAGQIGSVGGAIALGSLAYLAVITAFGIPEAEQIRQLVAGRFKRRPKAGEPGADDE